MTAAVLRLLLASVSDDDLHSQKTERQGCTTRVAGTEASVSASDINAEQETAALSIADAELAERIRAGDTTALTQIVHAYFDTATKLAYRFVGSRDTALDIGQDVFIALWERRASFSPTRSIRGYILSAIYSRARRYRRNEGIRANLWATKGVQSDVDVQRGHADETDVLVTRDIVTKLLATLPARRRAVLELRFLGELSYEEVANVLGVSPETVRKLAVRAIEQLRKLRVID